MPFFFKYSFIIGDNLSPRKIGSNTIRWLAAYEKTRIRFIYEIEKKIRHRIYKKSLDSKRKATWGILALYLFVRVVRR